MRAMMSVSQACGSMPFILTDPDADAARDRDHHRLRSSRTRCNSSVSTYRTTRSRQAAKFDLDYSGLARCAGGEDDGCGALVDAK